MRELTLALLGAAVMTFGLLVAGASRGQTGQHGHGHADGHDWYQHLQRPNGGGSCCNKLTDAGEGDCRPVRAFLGDDGWWRAIVDGRPVRIPPATVLNHAASDGNAHLCMSKAFTVYCFIAPQPKS